MDQTERLKMKHAKLEHDLSAELAKKMPDPNIIAELKRQKLALKDQLVTR